MKSALPSPLLLIYVLVTCVSSLISKRRTGFSTVRKHIIRHRAIFEVFPYEIRLQIFEKPPCAEEALREILKIFKLMEIFRFFPQWAYAVYMVANSWFRDQLSTCIAVSWPFDLMFEQIPSLTQSYCPGEVVIYRQMRERNSHKRALGGQPIK
jgi:hypothetical protein